MHQTIRIFFGRSLHSSFPLSTSRDHRAKPFARVPLKKGVLYPRSPLFSSAIASPFNSSEVKITISRAISFGPQDLKYSPDSDFSHLLAEFFHEFSGEKLSISLIKKYRL